MAEQPKTRRIRIEHGGSMRAIDAKITDAETGEQIRYVSRVELVFDASEGISAILYVFAPDVDITVDAEVRTLPGAPPEQPEDE